MRNRDPVGFDTWLEQAKGSLLASFASGLQRDGDSIRAAFEEIWSTGPVEGQINKLKLIKRRMYGRAKQDLLRQMVLAQ
ncbi:transposase [Ochrobactrum quorumnocens]|uniref:transposase n=1 Tax=Ochrobactrum quorumnocens TaxID=271865 RepID=UPI00385426F7